MVDFLKDWSQRVRRLGRTQGESLMTPFSSLSAHQGIQDKEDEEKEGTLGGDGEEYLKWYSPEKEQAALVDNKMVSLSPCSDFDRGTMRTLVLSDPKTRKLYYEGVLHHIQSRIVPSDAASAGGIMKGSTDSSRGETSRSMIQNVMDKVIGDDAEPLQNLSDFASKYPEEFLSAFNHGGLRTLGKFQASSGVCFRVMNAKVHSLLQDYKNVKYGNKCLHKRKIWRSVHGSRDMLLRGSDSVEIEDELWKLTWTEDVLHALMGRTTNSRKDRVMDNKGMEAYVVMVPYAAARMEKGLLYSLVKNEANLPTSESIYENPAVQAVIEFKWAEFGNKWVKRELAFYLVWLASFTIHLSTYQDWLADFIKMSHGSVLWIRKISIMVSFIFMLPFNIIEIVQMCKKGLLNWLLDFWNMVDVLVILLQWVATIQTILVAWSTPWDLRLRLAVQVFLLFAKVQYFSRTLDEKHGSLVDAVRAVIVESTQLFASIAVMLVAFAFAFGAVFEGTEDEDEHAQDVTRLFNNPILSFMALFTFWTSGFEVTDFSSREDRVLALLSLTFFQIIMGVVAFNLLIAVVTESFQRVAAKKEVMLVGSRAELILELESLQAPDWFYGLESPKYLHFLKVNEVAKGQPVATGAERKDKSVEASNTDQMDASPNMGACLGHEVSSTSGLVWKERDCMHSRNGIYQAIFEDGVLKFSNLEAPGSGFVLGENGSMALPRTLRLDLQGDLVMEDDAHFCWFTGSAGGAHQECKLTLEDNGLFILWDGEGRIVWFAPNIHSTSFLSQTYSKVSGIDLMNFVTEHSPDGVNFDVLQNKGINIDADGVEVSGETTMCTFSSYPDSDREWPQGIRIESENANYRAEWEEEWAQIVVYDQRIISGLSRVAPSKGRQVWRSTVKGDSWNGSTNWNNAKLYFYQDGALRVVDEADGVVIWESHEGSPRESLRPYILEMSDDRNLVIYDCNNDMVWFSSGRSSRLGENRGNSARAPFILYQYDFLESSNKTYKAIMEQNGEFALFRFENGERTSLWSTGTMQPVDEGPYLLEVTAEGNIVVKSRKTCKFGLPERSRKELEGSVGPYSLALSDNGVLTLYDEGAGRKKLWSLGMFQGKFRSLGNTLTTHGKSFGASINPGEMLESDNKKYRFKMEATGQAKLCSADRGGTEETIRQIGHGKLLEEQPFKLHLCGSKGAIKLICNSGVYFDANTQDGEPPFTLELCNNGCLKVLDNRDRIIWHID